ncbi:MAG: hypothetical protein AAF900_01930 [Bacteroidota bacterium]
MVTRGKIGTPKKPAQYIPDHTGLQSYGRNSTAEDLATKEHTANLRSD